jgi:chromatin remodeling complex protein RSC6
MNFSKASAKKKLKPDKVLAEIVGTEPRPRSEILKDFWQYIKEQGLQDSDRRVVNADRTLQPVLGGQKQVNIFLVADLVTKHMK